MNYFGIWVPKGAPDNVVKTMTCGVGEEDQELGGAEEIRRSRAARCSRRSTARRPRRKSFKMVRYTAWLYFDAGKAKVSPDTLGIPRL